MQNNMGVVRSIKFYLKVGASLFLSIFFPFCFLKKGNIPYNQRLLSN